MRPSHLREGQGELFPGQAEHDRVRLHPQEPPAVGTSGLDPHVDELPHGLGVVPGLPQPAFHPGGGDLQDVRAGDRIVLLQEGIDGPAGPDAIVEGHASGAVHLNGKALLPTLPVELPVVHLHLGLGCPLVHEGIEPFQSAIHTQRIILSPVESTTRGTRVDCIPVAGDDDGQRVDRVVARQLGIPRSLAQHLVGHGKVRIGGQVVAQDRRVRVGEEIEITWEGPGIPPTPLPIPILYEDDAVVVVNKPRGLKVHPTGAAPEVTVVSALLARGPLAPGGPGRPGVVHRLDAATTGALVLAKSPHALRSLSDQFRQRQVRKEYLALVEGEVDVPEGMIEGRLGRDAARPGRMRVGGRKDAKTEFSVLTRRDGRSLLLVRPLTGRTHQIRVHLAAIGHPVVGDGTYGRKKGALFLHSWHLGFRHPSHGGWVECEAEPPPEFSPWLGGRGSTGQL